MSHFASEWEMFKYGLGLTASVTTKCGRELTNVTDYGDGDEHPASCSCCRNQHQNEQHPLF